MTVPATPDPTEAVSEPVPDAAPTRAIPDRADAPVSEVTERFLRAIVADVPLTRIEELHLFSPLRQGTVETGIAVFAATAPVPTPVNTLELALDDADVDVIEAEAEVVEGDVTEGDAIEGEVIDGDVIEGDVIEAEVIEAADIAEDEIIEAVVVDVEIVDADNDDAEVLDDEADVTIEASSDALADAPIAATVATPVTRHTVYTARYRLVVKGPERGKWEASVVAEAEAPLITVETVVRGVQRRAGEESEIVRYNGAQIAKALRLPA